MYPSEPFPHFVDDVLSYLYESLPARASLDGIHLHDDLLDDLSRQGIDSHARSLAGFSRRLNQIDREALSPAEQVDHRVVTAALEGLIFDLERVRSWERSPIGYARTLGAGLAGPTFLAFAPDSDRARRLLSRLRQVPRFTKACQDNLRDPAGILVKLGLEAWRGIRSFLERDLPRGFSRLDDLHLLGDLADASQEAVEAVGALTDYLEKDAAPRAKGSFRLGTDVLEHQLRNVEGISVGVERAMELGLRWLSEAQEDFRALAAQLGKGDAQEIWSAIKVRLQFQGPPLDSTRETLGELAAFLNKQTLVAFGGVVPPVLGLASEMERWQQITRWIPGPFETRPTAGRLSLAGPDQAWTPERRAEHNLDLNDSTRLLLLAREAYPGRLTLDTALRTVDSKVRRSVFFESRTFSDGWSHYAEGALLEAGFRRADLELRLAQVAEVLVGLSRLVVAIRLHADDMSVEQGVRFFKEEAFLEDSTARREAERGVFDPGYMCQAMGRRLVLRLRRDYDEQHTTAASSRVFHDALLANGSLPIWGHRLLLLNDRDAVTFD